MMADSLDTLRKDALASRVKGAAGGNRIEWSAKDIAVIRDHIAAMPLGPKSNGAESDE
jgi:hypothetical protein